MMTAVQSSTAMFLAMFLPMAAIFLPSSSLTASAIHLERADHEGRFLELLNARRRSLTQEDRSLKQRQKQRYAMKKMMKKKSNSKDFMKDSTSTVYADDHEEEDYSNCQVFQVLLTSEDTAKGLIDGFSDFSDIDFGTIQGGKILVSNPTDSSEKIAEYTVFTTFLGPFNFTTNEIDCKGMGAYQFDVGQQITFSAACTGLPYLTITGGQGMYSGAYGYSEITIPHPEGNLHELHVCTPK